MVLLKIVGSITDTHSIIKELALNENVHLNLNIENSMAYLNYYNIHQYELESKYIGSSSDEDSLKNENIINRCGDCIKSIEKIGDGLNIDLELDKKILADKNYTIYNAYDDLQDIELTIGDTVEEINDKKKKIQELQIYRQKIDCIADKGIEFDKIADMKYFDYEIGSLSRENRWRLKKNYENLTAIVFRIGDTKSCATDLYMVIYPRKFKNETNNLLKSLSWNKLELPESIKVTPLKAIEDIDKKIENLNKEINELSRVTETYREDNKEKLIKIYNYFKLEEKIIDISEKNNFEHNILTINFWVQKSQVDMVKESIASVAKKYIVTERSAEELHNQVLVPTMLKNNWFTRPFELIVRMYGLPAYNELDPTPFLALTFCLAFGIMFGDIGQGLVYFLAGFFLRKKLGAAAQVLMRLGGSSIIFGFVYGSLFGLEKHELPWLPSLIEGGPLSPDNIPKILLVGIGYGIIVLTVSYVYGIINCMKNKNIEEGLFGKNGAFGYLFFISFIITLVSLTGIINLPIIIPIIFLIISLVVMVLKEPITNLLLKKKPLFHHGASEYFTESIFEEVETILSTLSNSISFVRVGAFALNHAGLFLAFMVMSEMVDNIFLKIFILAVGNVLILTLEGLIVFIQGLRLQYYEMFSKFFKGDGVDFKPIKLKI